MNVFIYKYIVCKNLRYRKNFKEEKENIRNGQKNNPFSG